MERQDRPIDRLVKVPVEGKEHTFLLVDKETGEPFSVHDAISTAYAEGRISK